MSDLMFPSGPAPEDCEAFFEGIINALPIPTFVVDEDVSIIHANLAAEEFLKKGTGEFLRTRSGEALGCINVGEEGCGRSSECTRCIIRSSVGASLRGGSVMRKKQLLEVGDTEHPERLHLLVTTSPLPLKGNGSNRPLALLMLEDITELIQLRSIIPVCAWCKKIRDDSKLWKSVEEYFSTRLDVDFTHGICNECYEKHFGHYKKESG